MTDGRTLCKAMTHILYHETCTLSHAHTQNLTPPRGLKRRPTLLPVSPFDCQYMTVPDLGESESWTTVHRVGECREGTERL